MSLKINGSNIKTIKVNGSEISLGKLNGYIIFSKQDTPEIPSTMATEWLDYGNPHFDGPSRAYDGLDVWIYYNNNNNNGQINGVYLDLDINSTSTFYMKAGYYSYAGGPISYSAFILDSDNNDAIVDRYDYKFDSNGSYTERELTVNLEQGNYKVVIGYDKGFEFGITMISISLT